MGNNDEESPYAVPFYFFEKNDIVVLVKDIDGNETTLSPSDYSVTGEGNEGGGELYTSFPIPNTSQLTIYRNVTAVQKVRYEEGDQFPANSHERALDRLTMLVQQALRAVSRSLRVRESDGEISETAKVASSLLGLDAGGNGVFRTADEVKSWLNLTTQLFDRPMMTFADSDERELATPNYTGQLATQRDTNDLYISTGVLAGNWILYSVYPLGITTAMLAANVLSADATGLAKMANGYLSADTEGRAKMADAFITLAKLGAGIFTADATGRGKFAAGFVDNTLLAANASIENLPAGAILQTVSASLIGGSTVSANIPWDNTIPQISEGVQILSANITPFRSNSIIRVIAKITIADVGGGPACAAIFRAGIANALVSDWSYDYGNLTWLLVDNAPGVTTPVTYSIRGGVGGGGTLAINERYNFAPRFGGSMGSQFILQEIKV